jgi:hypothetical protein
VRTDSHQPWFSICKRFQSFLDHHRLGAATADPTPHLSIRENDCLINRLARDRSLEAHNGSCHESLAAFQFGAKKGRRAHFKRALLGLEDPTFATTEA